MFYKSLVLQNLQAGKSCDAMVDFSGGAPETFLLRELRGEQLERLGETLLTSYSQDSLLCCSITAHPHKFEAKKPNGLVMGHAYSITKVLRLTDGRQFVRVRNPWGDQQEWTGPWSDSSQEWIALSEADRESFGLTVDTDGEWWMVWRDFVENFDEVEICHSSLEDQLLLKVLQGTNSSICLPTTYFFSPDRSWIDVSGTENGSQEKMLAAVSITSSAFRPTRSTTSGWRAQTARRRSWCPSVSCRSTGEL